MPEYGTVAAEFTDRLSRATKGLTDRMFGVPDHILQRTKEGQVADIALKRIYYPVLHQEIEKATAPIVEGLRNGTITGHVDEAPIISAARKKARETFAGPNDARLVTLAKSIEKRHDPIAAQSFANAMAFHLKDNVDPMSIAAKIEKIDPQAAAQFKARNAGLSPYSSLKKRMIDAGVGLTDTKPTYTPVTRTEGAVSSALHSAFAPMIFIPHVATIFNGLFGTTPEKFLGGAANALSFSLKQGISDSEAMMITGAFAETHLNTIREWNMFKATGVPKWRANSPAYFMYKILHQPGFRPLRDYTLLSGVNMATMTATDYAAKFAKNPSNKQLAWHLMKFGIEPNRVLAQHGNLSTEDLERAAFRYVDDHFFIDNAGSRSMLMQGTPAGRILGMYHGYVTRQAKLMGKALVNGFKGAGPLHTAKNLAIMATLFPALGEMINLTQMSIRGQNASGKAQDDIEALTSGDPIEAASVILEAYSHVGAFGIYNHLLRGSYTHSIINQAVGPTGSSIANLTQDTYNAGRKITSGRSDDLQETMAPVERDLMYDIPGVSTLAYIITHRVLPKANENPDDDPARQLYAWFNDDKPKKEKK